MKGSGGVGSRIIAGYLGRPLALAARAGKDDICIADYLETTGQPYFSAVRDLLEAWFANYPHDRRNELANRLWCRDDDQFDAAFWELYLHEAYHRAGCSIEVEPSVPGTPRRPDFLVRDLGGSFYLEATSVRPSTDNVGAAKRLAQIEEAFRSYTTDQPFYVAMRHHRIGPASIAGGKLVRLVEQWLSTLDLDVTNDRYSRHGVSGLPRRAWEAEGWAVESPQGGS